ncbi:hypothetical protein GCM10010885_11800 [Alicyclobacillus cellulosilyticus]|uniref:Uncharacterized protein n=1 Tax=Alicyclobacillus cellulosilyticus TaxID=1003997 RepID=A0A917NKA6_9BACL|nr:hypothetical protein [Alicyclobacillus cellulosilyticus]GGJ04141.1 hypothetical protein GCM10010885_11800 [Alicyclobacillus cellulosilyticus]
MKRQTPSPRPAQAPLAELAEQNQRYRLILFAVLLIAVTAAIYAFINWAQGRLHPGTLFVNVLQDIASTTFSLAVVGLIFEWWNRRRSEEQLRSAIVDAIMFSDEVLRRLTHEAKFNYIQRMLRAMLGPRRGDALYAAYIRPFAVRPHAETLFRTSFKYDITFLPSPAAGAPSRPYHRVIETIEYEKAMRLPDPALARAGLYLVAALREDDLAPYFADPRCVYRSVMGLADADAAALADARDPVAWAAAFHQVLEVRINGQPAKLRTVYEDGVFKTYLSGYDLHEAGPGDTEDTDDHADAGGVRLHLRAVLETVHATSRNFYTVYLSEPSRAPEVTFRYHEGMRDVVCLRFLSGVEDGDVAVWHHAAGQSLTLKVRKGQWVFPTSGVVFVWKH